jgi:small-conductance mechanosensitive channel
VQHRTSAIFIPSLVLVFVLGSNASASGQEAAPAAANQAVVGDISRAPVVIDGEQLFLVRGITSYPATQRAREIEERIRTLAADPAMTATSLTFDEQPGAVWILANGQRLMAVLDEDARLEQVDRGTLAQAYRARIVDAVGDYRRARTPGQLWRGALYALGATLALFLGAYLGRRLVGWLQAKLKRRFDTRVQDVHIQAFQIVKAEQIWRLLSGVLNVGWVFGVLAMVFVYLRYALGLFPWTRALGNGLVTLLIDPLQTMAAGLVGQVPNIAFLLVLVLVTRYLLKMVRLFFHAIDSGTVTLLEFDADWAWPTYRLVRMLVIALAVIVAYPYIPGSQSDAFKGITVFIGIVFSLGSSSLIGNVIAGYSMTYRRAFRIGDRIKVGDHIGEVVRMRLLVTHLRTPKNEEVIVPNSQILGAEIVNYTSLARERGLILHTTVRIGYQTPWRQVEALLIEAAGRTPGLLHEPPPFVLQQELGDFSVAYEINVYCNAPENMFALYTALHRNILDVFNEYGVQIMTPAYEADPEQPKLVPKARWYAAPADRP